MSWRTVAIASSAKLDYQLGFLVIRKEDTVKIHLGEIADCRKHFRLLNRGIVERID